MAKATTVKEYLIKITPTLDNEKYNKVMSDLRNRMNKTFQNKTPQKDQLKETAKTLTSIKSVSGGISKTIAGVGGTMAIIIASVKVLYDLFKKLTDKATEFSNKMITANSAFVNKETRDLIGRFGVSSQTATGMSSVMNLMGISVDDMKRLTPGQMTLYSKLMNRWTQGMNSIDPKKMQYFNEVMQNFQSEFASAKLELQIQLYQMLIEMAPSLEKLFNSFISFFKSISDFITSPVITNFISAIGEILSFFLNISTLLFDISTGNWGKLGEDIRNLSGGNTSTTNTTYNINSTTTQSFSGDFNTMFDLANNLDTQNNQTLSNVELRTGRI